MLAWLEELEIEDFALTIERTRADGVAFKRAIGRDSPFDLADIGFVEDKARIQVLNNFAQGHPEYLGHLSERREGGYGQTRLEFRDHGPAQSRSFRKSLKRKPLLCS